MRIAMISGGASYPKRNSAEFSVTDLLIGYTLNSIGAFKLQRIAHLRCLAIAFLCMHTLT